MTEVVERPCSRCGTRPRKVSAAGRTYTWCRHCLVEYTAERRAAKGRSDREPRPEPPARIEGTFRLSLAPGRGSAPDRTRFVLDTPNMHEAGELDHWQLSPWLDAALRWANRHDLDKVVTVWPLPSEAFDCLLAERLIARQLAIYSVQAYGLPVDEDDED